MALTTDVSNTRDAIPESPLDHDHLSRQTFGDRDLQAELLGLFRRETAVIVAALIEVGTLDGGPARARAIGLLHTLCGSARAVGFWAVGLEAELLEGRIRRQAGDADTALNDRIDVAALVCAVHAANRACHAFLTDERG